MTKKLFFAGLLALMSCTTAFGQEPEATPLSSNTKQSYMTLVKTDGSQFIINPKGMIVLELPENADVQISDNFQDGWGGVEINGKWGLLDDNGWVRRPQFDLVDVYGSYAYTSNEGDVEKEGAKHGILKKDGTWVVEPTNNLARQDEFDNTLCLYLNGLYGFFNENGWIVEPKYIHAGYFSEGLVSVKEGDYWGFADKSGNIRIKPEFESVTFTAPEFHEGLALVGKNRKAGFINHDGEWVIQPQFDIAENFKEGRAAVMVEGKCGFIDKTGKVVAETRYEAVGYFSDGLAAVMLDGKWGYIDTTGRMVIEPQFFSAKPFDAETGRAKVRVGDQDNNQSGYIDKTGKFTPDSKEQ